MNRRKSCLAFSQSTSFALTSSPTSRRIDGEAAFEDEVEAVKQRRTPGEEVTRTSPKDNHRRRFLSDVEMATSESLSLRSKCAAKPPILFNLLTSHQSLAKGSPAVFHCNQWSKRGRASSVRERVTAKSFASDRLHIILERSAPLAHCSR